jgi:hypothetical protein
MKTVQRLPSLTGARELNAASENSRVMLIPSLPACSSRKAPVPAAQTRFMRNFSTLPRDIWMYFESWPPISMTVSASGKKKAVEAA